MNTWIVCRRELAAYFATPLAYLFLFIFQTLSGICTFFLGGFYERGQADLRPFFDYHPWLYLILIPAVSMRLWAEERRCGSIELLLTLPLTLAEAILGKFLAAWLFVGLALSLTFPMWLTVNWLGTPDNGVILAAYLGSWLMAGAYLAVGEALSAATSSQAIACIATAVICFLLTAAGTPVVLEVFHQWAPSWLVDHVANLSFFTHFQLLARGTLELRDLLFFICMLVGWLVICAAIIARSAQRLMLALALFGAAAMTLHLPSIRIDLTESKLYTLSPGTRHLLTKLQEPVTLEFYFSDRTTKDMPGLRAYARRIRDFLQEYERIAKGTITVVEIDPEPFSEAEDRALAYGLRDVRPVPGAAAIYFGLAALTQSGKRAVIPFFNQEREAYLEYDISELLVQVSRSSIPHLAIYAEPDLLVRGGINPWNREPQVPWVAADKLASFYAVTWLDKHFQSIPEETELLVLIHPKGLAEPSLYAIDQFVLRGGKALIFVDPYAELDGPPRFVAPDRSKSSDLNRLFRAWGFEHSADRFVGDERYATQVTIAQGRPPARHLGVLSLDRSALSEDITLASLDRLVLSSAGAIRPLPGANIRFLPLISSSDRSMEMPIVALDYLFDPAILYDAFKPSGQSFTLAARIEGRLKSAFPDGPPPGSAFQPPHLSQAKVLSRLLVVGDSDLLANRLWVRIQPGPDEGRMEVPFTDNGAFLINAIDHLTGNPELLSIRGRGQDERRFERVEALRRQAETQFQTKLEQLQQQLEAAERKLAELKTPTGETEAFQQERLKVRKELRQLQYQFNRAIEALGTRLKLINILLAPLLLTLCLLALAAGGRWYARHRPL